MSQRPLPPRIAETAAHYDRQAASYDTFGDWIPYESMVLGPALGNLAVDSMLDLGAGTGHTIHAALDHITPKTAVAVDASAAMLAQLRAKTFPISLDTVHADIASYLAEPGPQFDLITSFGTFEFVPELPVVLSHVGERLAPNGTMVMTYEPREPGFAMEVWHRNIFEILRIYRYTREEVEEVLRAQKLDVQVTHLPKVYRRGDWPVSYDFVVATKPDVL